MPQISLHGLAPRALAPRAAARLSGRTRHGPRQPAERAPAPIARSLKPPSRHPRARVPRVQEGVDRRDKHGRRRQVVEASSAARRCRLHPSSPADLFRGSMKGAQVRRRQACLAAAETGSPRRPYLACGGVFTSCKEEDDPVAGSNAYSGNSFGCATIRAGTFNRPAHQLRAEPANLLAVYPAGKDQVEARRRQRPVVDLQVVAAVVEDDQGVDRERFSREPGPDERISLNSSIGTLSPKTLARIAELWTPAAGSAEADGVGLAALRLSGLAANRGRPADDLGPCPPPGRC